MRLVVMSCPPGGAAALLSALVAERLVACGNIVPGVRSIYRWKGEVQDEAEELVWMETRADRVEALMRRITELHPYEVPKVVTLTPAEVLPAYLSWVGEQTDPS